MPKATRVGLVRQAARLITEQLKTGVEYDRISKAISIFILDWDLTKSDPANYHHRFRLLDENTGFRFPDLFEINTLELPKLPRQPDGSSLNNWLMLFTAKTREEFDMIAKTSPELAEAVAVLMELSQDEPTRRLAEAREKARRDDRQHYARQQGRQEERFDIARTFLRKKYPMENVAEVTGLSLAEVQALAQEIEVSH